MAAWKNRFLRTGLFFLIFFSMIIYELKNYILSNEDPEPAEDSENVYDAYYYGKSPIQSEWPS